MRDSCLLAELQHRIWQLTLGDQLTLAPIEESKEVKDVIDLGCGT
jgi:hypothetical protein